MKRYSINRDASAPEEGFLIEDPKGDLVLYEDFLRPEAATGWKLAKSDDLPSGPPVEPGTTLYAFRHADEGHWEYDLPALPSPQ